MTDVLQPFLDGYATAWVERDTDALLKLFTSDAEYRDDPYQPGHQGTAGIRDYWDTATSTQSDITVRYGKAITVGHQSAVEWWTTLTNDGAPVTLAGSFVLSFAEDGRCQNLREYWHLTEGTIDPPAGWGE